MCSLCRAVFQKNLHSVRSCYIIKTVVIGTVHCWKEEHERLIMKGDYSHEHEHYEFRRGIFCKD